MSSLRYKIIMVDDNLSSLEQDKKILKSYYEIFSVPSSARLFELLEEVRPDLILLDVLMPEMDGYDAIRILKADDRYADIPVIFLTSLGDECNEQEGFDLGAADYVTKPFSAALLRNRINNLLLIEKKTKDLQASEEAARTASRAKSDFLSHMSHEIRSPLNAIIGMISIGMNTDDIVKKDYCLTRADSASKHLLGLINDILDMSKIEAEKFELSYSGFDFEQMIKNITSVANVKAEEKQHEFVVEMSDDIPVLIESDELRLSQVIMNLLSNAIKFTPENGTIMLNVETVSEHDNEVRLRFEVADSGIGISKEQQDRLFESFSQADASITKQYGGTGLGLAITKRIVELMGGNIWIESELGHGAKFIFTMTAKKLSEKPHAKLAESIKTEGLNILAVDDSLEVREFFTHVMESLHLTCHVAAGGVEAIEMINKADRPYSIFFIDWHMPEMDGVELLHSIAEVRGGVPVVMMTSGGDWSLIEKEAEADGVRCFISKPLFPSTLIDAINTCIGLDVKESMSHLQDTAKRRYDFSGYTLLIAEDVEINREIMSAILDETKISIDYAENGKIAVSMYQENPDRYNLILMDVNMPEMNGYEATRAIRALDFEKAKTIPIAAMTANVFKEDIDKCIASGMNDHTGKPIDANALFGMLNKYLTRPQETGRMKNVYELDSGLAWNESFLLGNTLVDMQHQRLFEKVSDLVKSCEEGSDTAKLQDTLEYLTNFAIRHFTDEEAFMIEHGYPQYDKHRQSHEDFNKRLNDYIKQSQEYGFTNELSRDVNKLIIQWLVHHIQVEDKKIGDYIRKAR